MKGLKLPKKKLYEVPGGLFKRLLALIIDFLIINIVIVSPFRSILLESIPDSVIGSTFEYLNANPGVVESIYGIIISIIIMIYVYFVVFDLKLGQTPGKMILRLHTVTEVKKTPITINQALIRNSEVIIFMIFFPLILLDVVYAIFNKEKKRLLENLSRTKTIERIELQ